MAKYRISYGAKGCLEEEILNFDSDDAANRYARIAAWEFTKDQGLPRSIVYSAERID